MPNLPLQNSIFESYTIESGAPKNTINLELPVAQLHSALRSALGATSASLRLTKKEDKPFLVLTIVSSSSTSASHGVGIGLAGTGATADADHDAAFPNTNTHNDEDGDLSFDLHASISGGPRVRETTVTQDVPVRVLRAAAVEGLHEPRCRAPDVHIVLPGLGQLKSVSERFTKLALASSDGHGHGHGHGLAGGPRLELSANMHGCLRLGLVTEGLRIASLWSGLVNPELDPSQVEGGVQGVREHPSTRMKGVGAGNVDGSGEEGWARVRIDGRDWGRVLSVGRLGGRVIACECFWGWGGGAREFGGDADWLLVGFCHEHALILYVYISDEEDGGDESVLTVSFRCCGTWWRLRVGLMFS